MLIDPTEVQLVLDPDLQDCTLVHEGRWCWQDPQGNLRPATDGEAADALLTAVVALQGQVLDLENAIAPFRALVSSMNAETILDAVPTVEFENLSG